MDLPEFLNSYGKRPPRKELQLQGPRPPPLKVQKDSHGIKKPPPAAAKPPRPAAAHPHKPVIIYSVSPKVIHADVSEFMTLVQRLTGASSSTVSDLASSSTGDISPAARLASVEKTSPSEREKERAQAADDVMRMVEGVEIGQIPGILSPAPANLQPISAGGFSPAPDPHTLSMLHDLSSPSFYWNSFLPSPSTLFSAPIISPTPSFDLLNQLMEF